MINRTFVAAICGINASKTLLYMAVFKILAHARCIFKLGNVKKTIF
jgi:hypothetical protein